MTRSLLDKLNPALKVQVFLSTLFRLRRMLAAISNTSELVHPSASTLWHEERLLHQLQDQIDNLLKIYPVQRISHAVEEAIRACKLSNTPDWPALFQLIAEFIQLSEADENIYYFLLRHHEDCKNTFGRLFLFNLFSKNGIKKTEKFLHDKFHERGFVHLKSAISTHFEGLKQCSESI